MIKKRTLNSLETIKINYDIVINATSGADIFEQALSYKVKGATFYLFSGFVGEKNNPIKLLNEIHYRQITMIGAYGCTREQIKQAIIIWFNNCGKFFNR